ncbi:FACT complex subunit spt16 [Irineochytrium annulatum]|nr:FACT complex subunit spt16 [Irineochytrium annulatum]
MAYDIDAKAFYSRLNSIVNAWKSPEAPEDFNDADCLLIPAGMADNDQAYLKTACLQIWLLAYEFPDSMILILPEKVVVLTSLKKGNIIETVEKKDGVSNKIPLEILKRTKDEAHNKSLFEKVIEYMKSSKDGKRIGVIAKDKPTGKFITEWKPIFDAAKKDNAFEEVDITQGIATAMAMKDDEDIKNIKMACRLTSLVMKNYFLEEFQNIIDSNKKVTHEKLALNTEAALQDDRKRAKLKFPKDVAAEMVEMCYTPIIQSGGSYDLKPSAVSDTTQLHEGTVLCSLGVRYKMYCSNLSRTFMVNPEKGKEANYLFLLELQKHVIELIKDGAMCKDLYTQAVEYIKEKRPELADKFVKNMGYGIGIEFKESTYALATKSTKALKNGMVVNLSLGFQNLENPETKDSRNKVYSLLVSDVIHITSDGPKTLTEFDKDFKEISWEMNDDEEEEAFVENGGDGKKGRGAAIGKSPAKAAKAKPKWDPDESNEAKRARHQKELAAQRNEEGRQRFVEGKDAGKALEKATFKKFECYRKENNLPKNVEQLRIYVDRRNEAIILPIYGMPVPFHISTLKKVIKNDEGDSVLLRFNFNTPGQSIGKKSDTKDPFENVNATFIKTIMFKSTDAMRFADIFKEVNEFQKEISKREAERKEMADLVEQAKLKEVKGRRPHMLREIFARPALEGKRGDLEIHENGVRYQSPLKSDSRIDVLFSNVKHFFYQPCSEKEQIVVIHMHLKNPIMIGRKKTKEVGDAAFDETGNRKRRYNHGDEDEIASEQELRRKRNQLNNEFKAYAEKIADASRGLVEVDVPVRDLGFTGVPFKQPVLLVPTLNCLVHLIEPPFLVVSIAEIELVHLERVRFELRSFDLVVVFKDYKRPVHNITSIATTELENVKDWLDSVDIPFTEGPANLSWAQIMKTINEDPAAFFAEGGWGFLQPESENEDDEEEEESEYADSDGFEGSDDSDSDGSGGSGDGSNASDFSDSDADEDEESGEDWDELEKKAEKADKKRSERENDSPPPSAKKKKRDGPETNGKKMKR